MAGKAISQAPTTPNLMIHVAHKIPTKWHAVGIQLHIKNSTLESFEKQTNDPSRLYPKVFDQWEREQNVPYTWNTIIKVLDVIDEKKTATEIRKWLEL